MSAVVGHGHSGKTTLTAGLLFTTGATNRLTRVDEGNTITDFDEEEIAAQDHDLHRRRRRRVEEEQDQSARHARASTSLSTTPRPPWSRPMRRWSLVDGVAGVEVQTEKVWAFAEEFQAAARHRDQQAGSRALQLRARARKRAGLLRPHRRARSTCPSAPRSDFKGVVDLVRMKAYTYTPDGDGKGKEGEIPADLAEAAQKAHEALVEMVAEGNDALMEEFFDKGTLPVEHIIDGLRDGRARAAHFPGAVRLGAAQHRHRSDSEFHRRELSRPRRARAVARHAQRRRKSSAQIADSEPVSAFVFKTVADPFAGRVTYFKVVSGVVKNDANLINVRNERRRAPGAHRLPCWARPSSPSPSCTPAISARSPS